MSVFDDVAVYIPSVRPRAAVLEATLAEWRRFGVEPTVQLQPDDWPLSGPSQRRNAERTLRRALDERPDATHILVSEDDILLAPELEVWIPALKQLHAPSTLYLTGLSLYPQSIRLACREGLAIPECIVRIRHIALWWGTLAMLLPRAIAEDSLRWKSQLHGWDIHLQDFFRRRAIPLYAATPNPVQHRGVPTSIPANSGAERSATFGRPSDRGGISPVPWIDWCPRGDWDPDPRAVWADRPPGGRARQGERLRQ